MSMVKKIITCIAVGAILPAIVSANTGAVYSVNCVGFQKIQAVSGGLTMGAHPFINMSGETIQEVVGDQLNGGSSSTDSDKIWKWDSSSSEYKRFFLFDSGGAAPAFDGKWLDSNFQVSNEEILQSDGFWLIPGPATPTDLTLVGEVPEQAVATNQIVNGLQILGHMYPVSVAINDLDLVNDGATGGTDSTSADRIWVWNNQTEEYERFFLFDSGGAAPAFDGKWLDSSFSVTDFVLEPGQGFWYIRNGASFDWTELKPYDL